MQSITMIRAGAILGALAVAAGAFGAHGLENSVSEQDLGRWQTGAEYQIYHALALIACGILSLRGYRTHAAAWCFLLGTVIFAGTLYGLGLAGPRWLGAITPIGGTLLIFGWASLVLIRPTK